MILRAKTIRVFFSPSRRRAAKIVNQTIAALESADAPAIVELLEFPSPPDGIDVKGSRLGRSWLDAYTPRFRRSYAIVGKARLAATPARVAPGDGSAPMVMSYWKGAFAASIESYELRSWPDCELLSEMPRRDIFESHANPELFPKINIDGPLRASRTGRFIGELPNRFPSKRSPRLIDVETARDLPPSGFEQAVSLLEGPKLRLSPWAFRFTDDERELVALYLPYTDKDWLESGPPDAARVEQAVAGGDAMVCRWDTGSGEPSEGSADEAALLEEYRRELACPDILKKPLRERFAMQNWPGVKNSGEPGMINWLFWKLMMHRVRRQSRKLKRLGRDALDGE